LNRYHGTVLHRSSLKPWSIAPLQLLDRATVVECSTRTRTRTHTHTAEQRLRTRVPSGRAVRFGAQFGRVTAAPRRAAHASWQQLATPTGQRAWTVRFLSPTTFRDRNRFSPWPDPFTVIRSLSARWTAHAREHHTLPALQPAELATIWVSDIDGANQVFPLVDMTVSGFVGRIRYVCEDPTVADTIDTLLRFAEFTGIGSYAPRGLGMVRLEPTWAPSQGKQQHGTA
jgi:hypothetical protein